MRRIAGAVSASILLGVAIAPAAAGSATQTPGETAAAHVAGGVAGAGRPIPAAADPPQSIPQQRRLRPDFATTVEVVQLQVTVQDREGRFVPGLTADDFVLRVAGAPRRIVEVREVDLRQGAPAERPTLTAESSLPPGGWRQFLLFFDLSFTTPRGLLAARNAAARFVQEQARPADLLAVATFSRIGGTKILSPFTLDRGQTLAAVSGLGLNHAMNMVDAAGFAFAPVLGENPALHSDPVYSQSFSGNTPGAGLPEEIRSSMIDAARSDFRRYREDATLYAAQLEELGELLRALWGRKHVLWFSAGFDDKLLSGQSLEEFAEDSAKIRAGRVWEVDSEKRFGSAELRASLEDALDALRTSDAVIHAFDTSLLDGPDVMGAIPGAGTSGRGSLIYLASGTSGTVSWDTNDLSRALQRVEEATGVFYVVAYPLAAGDPEVVKLEVEVRHPAERVVSAPARLAPPPSYAAMSPAQRQLQVAEFISKGIPPQGFAFEVDAEPFAGLRDVSRVAVVTEIPWAELVRMLPAERATRAEIDILGYVMNERGTMIDFFSRRVGVDVEALRGAGELPLRYYDLLWAPPGLHHVRVLLRETSSGSIGTRTVSAEIPAYTSSNLTMSGPVFIDGERPGLLMRGIDPKAPPARRAGGPVSYPFTLHDRELTPRVMPAVIPGERCHFFLVVRNLARHPLGGGVRASLDAAAVDSHGEVHSFADLVLRGEEYEARGDTATWLVEARVPDAVTQGAYTLRVTLTDRIAGARAEGHVPFIVEER